MSHAAEQTHDNTANAVGVGSGTLVSRVFGFPIWTEDHDGEIRRRRARILPDGNIVTRKIYGEVIGYANGTFPERSYIRRWWPRKTLFG